MVKKSQTKEVSESIQPVSDREKYLTEIKELAEQLKVVDEEWAKRASLANDRELLLLAIAERKGIIAYLNSKGE